MSVSLEFLGNLAPLMGIISVTLIIASEMFSLSYGRVALRLNRKKLRFSAIVASLFFSATILAKVLIIVSN